MEARDYLLAIRALGLTQIQIAKQSGVPQPTISKIERGETKDVLSKNFLAIQRLHHELCSRRTTAKVSSNAELAANKAEVGHA